MPKIKKVNKKVERNEFFELFKKYLPSYLKGMLVVICGILFASFAYYKTSINSDLIYFSNYFFIALAAFISGNSTYNKFKGRGIINGVFGAVPLVLSMLIFIAVFSYNTISAFVLIIVPIGLLFGSLGGIIGSNTKKRY